jgi:hypothetical protein
VQESTNLVAGLKLVALLQNVTVSQQDLIDPNHHRDSLALWIAIEF